MRSPSERVIEQKHNRAENQVLENMALKRNWQRKGVAGKRHTTIKTKNEKKEVSIQKPKEKVGTSVRRLHGGANQAQGSVHQVWLYRGQGFQWNKKRALINLAFRSPVSQPQTGLNPSPKQVYLSQQPAGPREDSGGGCGWILAPTGNTVQSAGSIDRRMIGSFLIREAAYFIALKNDSLSLEITYQVGNRVNFPDSLTFKRTARF